MPNFNWNGIGGLFLGALAIGGMAVAVAMFGDALKGRMKKIASVGGATFAVLLLFAIFYTGAAPSIASAFLGFLGIGGAKPAPGFAP